MAHKKILIAVDGSAQALEGVRYAVGSLNPGETRIVLLSVTSRVPEFFYDLGKEPLFKKKVMEVRSWEKSLRDSLEKFMAEVDIVLKDGNFPKTAVVTDIRERKEGIARDIIRESKKGYNAVIVGRSGLSRFKDLIMGSTAQKLLVSMTDVSLWIVGGRPQLGRILVAMDESEGSMQAVDHVVTMLNRSMSQITLFHVIRGYSIFEGMEEYRFEELDEEKSRVDMGRQKIEAVFKEAARRLTRSGFDPARIKTKVVTGASSRAGAIVEEARSEGYGTIVVGRRGLSKVQEFFMGRVSSKVVQAAKEHAVWVVK